jgi:hypothetical protein
MLKIQIKDMEECGYNSVTDYCRMLVKFHKNNPEDLPKGIELYRGDMLCMTIPNIAATATVEPGGTDWNKYSGRRGSKGRGFVKTM